MILNNWWAYLAAIYTNPPNNYGSNDITTGVVTTDGNLLRIKSYLTGYVSDVAAQLYKYNPKLDLSLFLSTNASDVDINEYALDGDIRSSFSITQKLNTFHEEGMERTVLEFTAINTSGSTKTVNSIGLIKSTYAFNGGLAQFIVLRELLDEPIVVPATQSFSRVFTWDSM